MCFFFGKLGDVRVFGGWFGGGSIVRVSHGCYLDELGMKIVSLVRLNVILG